MKPRIDVTVFGSITIAGVVYEHDVLITLVSGEEMRCYWRYTAT